MESIFINAGIAAGVGLAALPVILHLFFRQTPKRIIFPALQLVRERQKRSRKKLKVKNWLLLLARMALIALMALALARPRLWSNTRLGAYEVPTAIALVFDTSLSMEYKERDKTRLDEAKDRARALLTRAHEASRVFVIDSSDPITPAGLSPAAAQKRVEGLAIRPVNRPLNAAAAAAYKAVGGAEQPRRDVFIFTDLARTAWDTGRPVEGADTAKGEGRESSTYLVRLAPKALRNASITQVEPAWTFTPQDEKIPIRAVIRSLGPESSRVVELMVDGVRRDQQPVKLPADGEADVLFRETPKLNAGLHRVQVRLSGQPDPLERDDIRFLALETQPPQRVLLISDVPEDAEWVASALDPPVLREQGPRRFPVEWVASQKLGAFTAPLREFTAIFVLNADAIPEADWGRINQYVRDGGGLVIGLGHRVVPEHLAQGAGSLLPATLGDLKTTTDPDFTFGRAEVDHPLFARDTRNLLAVLATVPILKYRAATPQEGARVLLSYTDNNPALIERVFPGPRAGRVLLWTTALARNPGSTAAEREAKWNEFPIVGWSFFALMDATVPYLSGLSGRKLNFEAGEDVTLPIEPAARGTTFTIQGPGTKPERLNEATGGGLLISAPPLIGEWKVVASGGGTNRELGFSVNVPRSETLLAPLAEADLAGLFGKKDRVTLIDDPSRLEKQVETGRHGRELFPLLMALILLLITAENVLANTFYRERPGTPAAAPTGSRAAA